MMVTLKRYIGAFILLLLLSGSIFSNSNPVEPLLPDPTFFQVTEPISDTCTTPLPDIICPPPLVLSCDESGVIKKIDSWLISQVNGFGLSAEFKVTVRRGEFVEGCSENAGTETVRFTVTNACGDSTFCISGIRYIDDVPPVFIQLDSVVTTLCSAAEELTPFVIRDNCDNHIFISYDEQTFSDENCNENYLLRTWEAEDKCGNVSIFVQTVVLLDTLPPAPSTIPQNKIVGCDEIWNFDAPRFRDDCSSVELGIKDTVFQEACSTVHIRTWTATDDCENVTQISQRVAIIDDVAPVFTDVPSPVAYYHIPGLPDTANVSAVDNCGVSDIRFEEDVEEGCQSIITRTWTAYDECGNSSSFVQIVKDTHRMHLNTQVFAEDCAGNPGKIKVEVADGFGPFIFNWSTGDTTASLNDLEPGTYSVTVVDFKGCRTEENYRIGSQEESFNVNEMIGPASCFEDIGFVRLEVTGHDDEFQFSWPDGSESYDGTWDNIGGGTYEVNIRNESGCEIAHKFTIPFQETCGGSLTGTVWEDLEGNAEWDSYDAKVANIQLMLIKEGTGEVARTVSAADGTYAFTGVGRGTYTVHAYDMAPYRVNERKDAGELLSANVFDSAGNTSPIAVSGDTLVNELNLSLIRPVWIGDRVWLDLDGDCIQDASEVGFESAVVHLLDQSEEVIATAVPDTAGFYVFRDAGPGAYRVVVSLPQGYEPCSVVSNAEYDSESRELRSPLLTLFSGQRFPFMDFGLHPAQTCPLEILVDKKNSTCNLSNGRIRLNIIGCGPFSYQWSNGERGSEIEGLKPGFYTCIVTDSFGKQVVKDIYVAEEESDMNTEIVEYADPGCELLDGFIQLETYGGLGPYSYEWNTGASGKLISELGSGKYEAVVTDRLGCLDIVEVELSRDPACDSASIMEMQLGVFLEGPYNKKSGKMVSLLDQGGYLPGQDPKTLFGIATPAGQPYNHLPWNYDGSEGLGESEYPSDIIDWILISLRESKESGSTVCRGVGWLLADGAILLYDDLAQCPLSESTPYYIVLEHRNHMLVMSHEPVLIRNRKLSYDFRKKQSFKSLFGSGQKEIATGIFAMFAGNPEQAMTSSSKRDINFNDVLFIQKQSGENSAYLLGDLDMNGDVNVRDEKLTLQNLGRFSDVPR